MAKIRLITDTGSDLKLPVAQRYNIRLIPFSYSYDGETYLRSQIDETTEEFYKQLRKADVPPKTTQITPAQFADIYREELDAGYDTIIVTTLSGSGSGTCQNANIAAAEVMDERDCDIRVVDSQSFTCLYAQPVIHAAKMAAAGASADEVEDYLKKATADFNAVFVVSDLEHLKKGGRINAATLLFANMLDIKPILTIGGGLVVQSEKVRGEKRVNKKVIEMAVKTAGDLNGRTVITVCADADDKLAELKNELKAQFPDVNILDCRLGPIIGTHCGPTLYGFAYSTSGEFDISDYEEE